MIRFEPVNFRTMPGGLHFKIRTQDDVTLIYVKASGAAKYGRTRSDKDAIIAEYADGDLLLLAWPGQWHMDIFLLNAQDISDHYREPNFPTNDRIWEPSEDRTWVT